MARPRYPKSTGPLPPPLPPETRTVGQLVAETIRFYGRRFWPCLALGLAPAALLLVTAERSVLSQLVLTATVGAVLGSASYVGAVAIVRGSVPRTSLVLRAYATALLVWVPFPFLAGLFVLPGLVWLAFVSLAVPAVMNEDRGIGEGFGRAVELARADFVHALGSLATLTIVVFLTQGVLAFVIRDQGDNTVRVAGFLANLVVSPLLYLGAALLYYDQAARVGLTRQQRRSVPPASRSPGSGAG